MKDFSQSRLRARAVVRSLCLSLALILGIGVSFAGRWERVGWRHAEYAKVLAASGIRFDGDHLDWVSKSVDSNCRLRQEAVMKEASSRVKLLRAYSDLFCKPWLKAWDKEMAACDRDHAPDWCDDEDAAVQRIRLDEMFAALSEALSSSANQIERFNLMAIAANAATPHVITEFPKTQVDAWLAGVFAAYLRVSNPRDVLVIARGLQETWYGIGDQTGRELRAYATAAERLDTPEALELLRVLEMSTGDEDRERK